MSKNISLASQPCPTDIKPDHLEHTIKISPIIGLVPQRKQFLNDKSFEQIMAKYIKLLQKLEMIEKLRTCIKNTEVCHEY